MVYKSHFDENGYKCYSFFIYCIDFPPWYQKGSWTLHTWVRLLTLKTCMKGFVVCMVAVFLLLHSLDLYSLLPQAPVIFMHQFSTDSIRQCGLHAIQTCEGHCESHYFSWVWVRDMCPSSPLLFLGAASVKPVVDSGPDNGRHYK